MADETTTRAPGLSPIDFSAPVTNDASASASGAAGGAPNAGGAACSRCATTLTGYYYESAGAVYCPKCKHAAENAAGAQSGGGGMGRAALFGFGAAIVGAIGYWAFIKITDFDWALVSIAVGMLVATAIRKGNGDRGGRRYQFLAVGLTYLAIGGAYAPFAVSGVMEGIKQGEAQHADSAAGKPSPAATTAATAAPEADSADDDASVAAPGGDAAAATTAATAKGAAQAKPVKKLSFGAALLLLVVGALAVVVAAPIAIIAGGFPGSIINILIVGFALRRAWQMTEAGVGVTVPTFSGPYNVKSRPAVAAHGG